jgi:hypothetical protein
MAPSAKHRTSRERHGPIITLTKRWRSSVLSAVCAYAETRLGHSVFSVRGAGALSDDPLFLVKSSAVEFAALVTLPLWLA